MTSGHPRELDQDILDITTSPPRAHYDLTAPAYDVLVGSSLWHETLWKTTTHAFRTFASTIYGSRSEGAHVELGCGSLLFTSHLYVEDRGRPVILIDHSVRMLRLARRRLRGAAGAVPRHVVLVRGDARDLRLATGWASTVLAVHVLHVLRERMAFLQTLASLARPRASTIGLTSIFFSGGRGDVFLRLLAATGELAPGLRLDELQTMLNRNVSGDLATTVEGSMAYLRIDRRQ
jgi:SAM-dependent methyltransferase